MKACIFSLLPVKNRSIRALESEYMQRLGNGWSIETRELPGERIGSRDHAELKRREGELLLSKLENGAYVVALDERGERCSSQEFAQWIAERQNRGNSRISFVIGGAYGFDQAVLERAQHTLSLSPLTFPYQIARLVLVEQLYRAYTILQNTPYHK